jgi:hypothetical protein
LIPVQLRKGRKRKKIEKEDRERERGQAHLPVAPSLSLEHV